MNGERKRWDYETADVGYTAASQRFLENSLKRDAPVFTTVSFNAPHTSPSQRGGKHLASYEEKYADEYRRAKWPRTPAW